MTITMFLLQPLLFLLLYVITTHFLHNIRNLPPTPFPNLPIIGHLHLFKKPLHRSLSNLSTRYGPLLFLRFGHRNVLVVSSPSAVEECFTKNDVIFANRPRLLVGKHLSYNFKSIAWAPYGDYWRNLRKISSLEIFSTHRLQLQSNIRSEEVRFLIGRIFKGKNKVVNLKAAFFELTINVMMRMIGGKRYYGDDVADVEEGEKFKAIVRDTFTIGGTTAADFLSVARVFGGIEKKMKELQKRRNGFIQDLIEERRKKLKTTGEKHWCMIDVLLARQQSEPQQYEDQVIKSLMLTLLAAGTDTSAATMEWIMSALLNNPEILRKAQEELDQVVGHDRLVSETDLAKLPYLRCIINEAVRLYPVAALSVPHESSEECTVGGYRVPSGTMLVVNAWAIQRDPTIWENPTEFKPERFEGVEGMRDGFKFMPFGAGRRSCPGEGLAARIVGLGVSSLLQCFEWRRPGEELVDMTVGSGFNMPKAIPLLASWNPRPQMFKPLSEI